MNSVTRSNSERADVPPSSGRTVVVLVLLWGSGFASLVYQVLWMRELSLLFGSTAHATAGTLAVFFGGLAIGGAVWSRRAPRSPRPLAEYGLVELGVGFSGVLYFGLMPIYAALYAPLHEMLGDAPALLLTAKLALASVVLLPPAILMGGTLPLIAQHAIRDENTLGRTGTLLYGANTLGAAAGALAAGFWLPVWLGFDGAYQLAVVVSLAIGVAAWWLARQWHPEHPRRYVRASPSLGAQSTRAGLLAPKLVIAALASGALALALEVLWTRMFQQVLQNSVYTFSIILVTFLAALSVGSLAARRVAQFDVDPWIALGVLMTIAAAATLATPFLFFFVTDGMRYLGSGEAWSGYLVTVFGTAAGVLFVPGVAVGCVFPYLLRVAQNSGEPGRVVGRLAALNTAGAIVGSLVAGFVLLAAVGLWTSLLVVALAYLVLATWMCVGHGFRVAFVPALGIVLALSAANPSSLPGVRLNLSSEQLLASWEGPDGFVAVIERDGSRRIKINNFYALGSSGAEAHEQNQTLIPLMPHPSPEHVFYLGMGTGITAGAALRLPSRKVTVTELVPEVVTAAREFFGAHTSGLFTDPRARVWARDGRNELRGNAERYDAVIADLFIPWRAGVGNLYSRDHYAHARDRLRPGGVYVQWIPLYQVTEVEFWTIARTFLSVFPQVVVWRGDFYVDQPILGLVGSLNAEPLDVRDIVRNGQHIRGSAIVDPAVFLAVTLPFYAGNLGESREIVPDGPIHTDDRPVIEYVAPVSHRNARAGRAEWFTHTQLINFFEQLLEATPPAVDPYLERVDAATRGFVLAGRSYHTGAVLHALGRRAEAQEQLQRFVDLMPVSVEFETVGEGLAVEEETR